MEIKTDIDFVSDAEYLDDILDDYKKITIEITAHNDEDFDILKIVGQGENNGAFKLNIRVTASEIRGLIKELEYSKYYEKEKLKNLIKAGLFK